MQQRRQFFRLLVTLTILWLLLSGMFMPLQLILGVISIAIVCYLSVNMKVLMHRGQPLYFRFFYVIKYCAWLIVQILLSNIDVVKRIFNPKLPIKPLLKAVQAKQKTELGRVVFANSITLTPGTVAINIAKNGDILVHALHEDAIYELESGEMGRRVCELEPNLETEISSNQNKNNTGTN
ncbi:MAG: multicomponent Na+:H+ antiporter subunit E [Cellvibrionaceae bacterium]|jgi:multicomponent Na+:H+ antiporter subunit E